MNRIFLTLIETYIISALPLGILFTLRKGYLLGYLMGILIGILDLSLIFIILRRKEDSLNSLSITTGIIIRVAIIIGAVSIFIFCGIINRLNILGLLIGLAIYPLVLLIGGLKILRCKK
jgi:Ca2+/H+ antiporter